MSGISAIFDAVSFTPPKKSTFDGTHDIKTSCKIGEVFPLDVIPVYPSDNFRMQYTSQAKFSPLVAPAFARMNLKQWSFYVRNADLWDDFQEFVSGVNPKLGKTAYNQDYNKELVHPYFDKYDMPKGRFVVKLNLANVDLSKIHIVPASDGYSVAEYRIESGYLNSLIQAMMSQGQLTTVSYHSKGDIKMLYGPSYFEDDNFKDELKTSRYQRLRSSEPSDSSTEVNYRYYAVRLNNFAIGDVYSSRDRSNNSKWTKYLRCGCTPSYVEPGDLLDYLGYPVEDYKSVLSNTDLLRSIMNYLPDSANNFLGDWFKSYLDIDGDSAFKKAWNSQKAHFNASTPPTNLEDYSYNNPTSKWNVENFFKVVMASSSDSFENLDADFNSSCTMFGILCRYLCWCKETNNTSTLVDDAPYFDFFSLDTAFARTNSLHMDSLRWRAYWKIWNDYYRHPNLTYEVPIPYNLGGSDLVNILLTISSDIYKQVVDAGGTDIYDWYGRSWTDPRVFSPYPDVDFFDTLNAYLKPTQTITGQVTFQSLNSNYTKMLFEPFKHLRERDYITGCLPNTSVVDVVAPIMPSSALDSYKENPWTNDSIKVKDGENVHDNTSIDPINATKDSYDANVGWLDIENLRITQKLKEYFVSLRHTLGSFKDYVKVFFGADISDLTLHRAEFLGGNSQNVNVSELISSAQSDNLPQGSLAGRANSFGSSGFIDKYVNDYGFIITLECLSPLEINVGGLSRQLIRDSRFDYFNPKFAELGDMAVTKKEVSSALCLLNSYNEDKVENWYDEIFGYTPRYMDLKFIPSHVHADFLGNLSDWHLDLIQSPINDKSVELSQAWLEERSSNRVFSEVYEDSNNCFIWSECRCVYQRALPAVSYEVIA